MRTVDMNEKDIIDLVRKDEWMMDILKTAEKIGFPNWAIGAGFLRNKVWDRIHGFNREEVETNDIDFVYYNPAGNDWKEDEELSNELKERTGIDWEIVNQAYAHKWSGVLPYLSVEDALYRWPETATGIGVRLIRGELTLIAPHGIDDLVNLIVRPSPGFTGGFEEVKERARKKEWFKKWPKLKMSE